MNWSVMRKNTNLKWSYTLAILVLPIAWTLGVIWLNLTTPLDSIMGAYSMIFGIPSRLIYSLFTYVDMPHTKYKNMLIVTAILSASGWAGYLFYALVNGESV